MRLTLFTNCASFCAYTGRRSGPIKKAAITPMISNFSALSPNTFLGYPLNAGLFEPPAISLAQES